MKVDQVLTERSSLTLGRRITRRLSLVARVPNLIPVKWRAEALDVAEIGGNMRLWSQQLRRARPITINVILPNGVERTVSFSYSLLLSLVSFFIRIFISFLPSFFSFFLWVFCEVFLLVIFSGWSFGGFSHVSPIPFLGWSVLIDWLVFQSIYRLVSFEFWPLFSLFHIADFRVSLIWWNWFEICSLFNFFFRPVVEIDFYDWFLGQYFGVELVIFDQVWVFISFRLLANLWLFWPISGSFLDPLKIPIQFWFYFLIQYQSVFFNGSVSISWSNSFWLVFSRILVSSFWLFLTNFYPILLQVFEASNAIFHLIMIDFQTNFVVDLDGTFNVLRLSLGQFE